MERIKASLERIQHIAPGDRKDDLMVGMGVDYRLLILLIGEPGDHDGAVLQVDAGHLLG